MKTPLYNIRKRLLLKHTATVHSSSSLTMVQKKIFNLFVYKAFPSIRDDKYHSLRVVDLMQSLSWSQSSNLNHRLKDALAGLTRENVKWNILEKDKKRKWVSSACLADVSIKDGVIEYSFGKFLREVLYNPNIYAKIDLDVQSTLDSKNSLVIWELSIEELSSKKTDATTSTWLEWEKICHLTSGNSASYSKNYALYKSKVLNKAIKEINLKTDLSLNLIEKKEGRKIKWVAFEIERDTELTDHTHKSQPLLSTELQKSMATILGCELKAKKLFEKYSESEVQRGVDYYQHTLSQQGNKIKNPIAFFMKALDEGWHTPEEAITRINKIQNTECHPSEFVELKGEESEEFLEIRTDIYQEFGEAIYKSWFHAAYFCFVDGVLNINHPNPYAVTQIKQKYDKRLIDIFKKHSFELKDILVNEEELV